MGSSAAGAAGAVPLPDMVAGPRILHGARDKIEFGFEDGRSVCYRLSGARGERGLSAAARSLALGVMARVGERERGRGEIRRCRAAPHVSSRRLRSWTALRARPSLRFAAPLALLSTLGSAAHVIAQPAAVQVSLDGAGDACVDETALRERVAHFRVTAADGGDVNVRVSIRAGTAEFTVLRDRQAVSRRRFERLPEPCQERRDTLALAIAVALAHAMPGEPVRRDESTSAGTDPRGSTGRPAARAQTPTSARSIVPANTKSRSSQTAPRVGTESEAPDGSRAGPSPSEAPADAEVPRGPMPESGQSPPTAAEAEVAPLATTADSQARGPDVDNALEPSPGPSQTSLEAPVRTATPERDDSDATSDEAESDSSFALSAFAGVRVLFELLPDPTWTFAGGVGLHFSPAWSLQLAGFGSLADRTATSGARVRTQAAGGELLGCLHTPRTVLAALGCAGLSAGGVHARGEDFGRDRTARLAWLAAGLRASLRWPASGFVSLRLALGAHVSLVRPEMQVISSNPPDLVRSVLGASLGLDLVVGDP